MAKNNTVTRSTAIITAPLYREIRAVLDSARAGAYHAVNTAMVHAYWHVGRLIVEHEQGGRKRAPYGEAVLRDLSRRLTAEFGRGFDARNLWYMRRFYSAFPILNPLRSQSGAPLKVNALRSELTPPLPGLTTVLRSELSWTHYRLLLGVEDPVARTWYMHEAADQHWSSRQLDRQISVLYYERLLASRRKAPVRGEAKHMLASMAPEQFMRDPYVLEFLNLKDYPGLRESVVEQAIINNLQSFLLELGRGFCFVARQKHLRFEEEDFYVDLVFYNYLLKCFVLIDLKVGRLTHQDIGQMDSYVRMFDADARPDGDNPTIGLILCSKKNEAIAKYSVLAEGRRLFAAKYVKYLPTETELRREIQRERRLIDLREVSGDRHGV
jgi:predicted nuclease of restriction endonuclease-like (RecB) superfamily